MYVSNEKLKKKWLMLYQVPYLPMSNTIEIITNLVGESTCTICPECGDDAQSYGYYEIVEQFYIHYSCCECYHQWRYRWVPKDHENDTIPPEEMFVFNTCKDCYYTFNFNKLRSYILNVKGKFSVMKAFLDYYKIDYDIKKLKCFF